MAVLASAPALASAQTIGLTAGSSSPVNLAPSGKLAVPIIIDLTNAGAANIASLQSGVTFGSTQLTFDSIRVVSATGWSLTPNTANAATGSLVFNAFSATAFPATGTLANLYFTAAATTGGTRVTLTPTAAGNDLGANILNLLRVQNLDVCVAPSGLWGDVNNDNTVNIIDAQQIARSSVGLSVANATALAQRGDVTNDGSVNIIDAQQIARFTVGLSAAARVNTALFTPPSASTVTLSPNTPQTVAIGSTVQLTATPKDANAVDITGCATVAFTTNNAAVATVNASGLVTGVSNGTATITATSNSQTATVTVTVGSGSNTLEMMDGNELASVAGLPVQARARVKSAAGTPLGGVTVSFAVTSGTGTTSAASAITAADGIASVTVTPPAAGAPNSTTYTATIAGVTPVSFTLAGFSAPLNQHTCMGDFWSVRCWGDNSRGQLGNGTNTSSTTPVFVSQLPATIGGVTQEGFGDHTCLLDAIPGNAYCWGANTAGQLGDSSYVNRNVPTRVKTALQFKDIGVGAVHTCALSTAGDVWCWGYNFAGQIGDSTFSNRRFAPVKVKAPNGITFAKLAVGSYTTCASAAAAGVDGQWYCWGQNSAGQIGDGTTASPKIAAVLAAGGASYATLKPGEQVTCGLTAAGAASCWGNQNSGGVGNGQTTGGAVSTPQAVSGGHVFADIYVGFGRACGRKADFQVWCWGRNVQGAIGDSTTAIRPEPTFANFTGYALRMGGTSQATAPEWTCGLTNTSQQVLCWGGNTAGVIGDGTTTNRLIPTLVPRAGATAAAPAAVMPVEPIGYQSAPVGVAVGNPKVILRDGLGNPIPNATITWDVLSGGGTFAGGVSTVTSQTDGTGLATGPLYTMGAVPGLNVVRASIPGTGPNNFTGLVRYVMIVNGTPIPAQMIKLTGDSAWVGGLNASITIPPAVKVVDASNNPIPGFQIEFTATVNSSLAGGAVVPVTTNAQGIAALPVGVWTRTNTSPGTVSQIVADYNNNPVTFTVFNGSAQTPQTSCEKSSGGTVYCWGGGSLGQLGDGTNTASRATIVPVSGGLTFGSLALGVSSHKCGLVGTAAYCWGWNEAGQLGDGTTTNRNVPTAVTGGLSFTQLAVGGQTTCGLTTGGQLYCWGWSGTAGFRVSDATRGRLFLTPTLVATGGPTFVKIALADDAVCGLTAAGTIHCLGSGSRGFDLDGQFDQRTTFNQAAGGPWKDMSATYLALCAIDQSDKASCAGGDQNVGALGRGLLNGNFSLLTQVNGGLSFASISSYVFGACGRQSTNDVYCWGNNGNGQAGTGTIPTIDASPTLIPGIKFTQIRAMGFRNQCGLSTNNALYCWGENTNGQIGDGSLSGSSRATPTAVVGWPDGPAAGTAISMTPARQNGNYGGSPSGTVVTPNPSVIVLDKNGSPVAGVAVTFAADAGSGTVTGGSATTDANGIAAPTSWTLPASIGVWTMRATATNLATVVFAASTTVAPATINIVAGNNQWLPDFYTGAAPLQVQVLDGSNQPINAINVTWTVAAGSGTGSGVTSTAQTATTTLGTIQGVATGPNWAPPTPANVTYTITATVAGLAPVTFSANRLPWSVNGALNPIASSCRLLASGQAACWGSNTFGQVGDNTTSYRSLPTTVSGGLVFTTLARSSFGNHQCALTAGGAAYCWGNNIAGQLGDGTQTNRSVPTAVSGNLTFASITAGPYSTCGVTTAGATYCWGWGSFSFRGDGNTYDIKLVPTLVNTSGRTFTKLAIGLRAVCGLDGSGQAFCWGENALGQLGSGNLTASSIPVATNTALRFSQVQSGSDHTCGLTTAQTVACWGWNATGAIGNGTTTNATTPLVHAQYAGAADIRTTEGGGCARNATQVWCWGSNSTGQVGDGSNTQRNAPILTIDAITPTSLDGSSRNAPCASTSSAMYCWGAVVPDGNGGSRNQPTLARWPDSPAGVALAVQPQGGTVFSGLAGSPLASPLVFKVVDAAGTAIAGTTVNFVVTFGGGSVSVPSAISDANGLVQVSWTLAGAVGTVNTMEARVTGLPASRIFGTVTAPPAARAP